MNTKALAASTLTLLILFLVGFIILAGVVIKVLPSILKASDREACILSIQARKYTTIGPFQSPISPECETFYATVKDKELELYTLQVNKLLRFLNKEGKHVVKRKKYDALTEDELYPLLAEELRLCWYQFLQGKQPILKEEFLSWGNNERFCFICDEITFETTKLRQFDNFLDYLKNTSIKGGTTTYYDYITTSEIVNDFYRFTKEKQKALEKEMGPSYAQKLNLSSDWWENFATLSNIPVKEPISTNETLYLVFIREGDGYLFRNARTYAGLASFPPQIRDNFERFVKKSHVTDGGATLWVGWMNLTTLQQKSTCSRTLSG
ncbi:hypothetical protein D6783_06045 [Candidatus Woesearchaeota archaeon]|nr:MAG: hypothetical protein D6783_06045 [Candidatus Woesearchaeota archaeon]